MFKSFKILTINLLMLFFISCKEKSIDTSKNELAKETSPYLLQHAKNPVNWKAWNDATLKLAKEEGKLMIISIGYSACHWCHVMEEESFENDSIAKIMNDNWHNLDRADKRYIVESITNEIIFDNRTILFKLKQIAPLSVLELNPRGQQRGITLL